MKLDPWQWLKAFPGLLAAPRPEPLQQAERIVAVQRRIVLPVKTAVLAVAIYFVFSVDWLDGVSGTRLVFLQTLRSFLVVYIFCTLVAAVFFFTWKRFPPGLFKWLVFVLGLLDGLFVAGLMLATDGWQSMAFWLFPVLIVLNAASIPLAMPQIVLNLSFSFFYIGVAILTPTILAGEMPLSYVPGISPPHVSAETNSVAGTSLTHVPMETNTVAGQSHSVHHDIRWDSNPPLSTDAEAPPESFVSNLFVLLLLTLCCYGVQALAERQRRELEEAREFAVREGQLHSAGRLAAEFAHQIKNPLAVIANAAFSLQRSVRENKNSAAQQIEIIQEEVSRADRIITRIMGYAQLSEGRVEKLDVVEELDLAIAQVFPPAVPTEIKIRRKYADYFPPLLMQRAHLSEIFVNLLKNAREAIGQAGNIVITASWRPESPVEISIRDSGCGIPADKLTRIFEAYYSNKAGGSGMGLAIVKHNTDLYGGHIAVKSEVGKGAEFILTFPPRAIMDIRK